MVDGLGNLHTVLEQKFGEKVKIKLIGKPGGLSLRRLFSAGRIGFGEGIDVNLSAGFAEDLVQALETRALWQRFGL